MYNFFKSELAKSKINKQIHTWYSHSYFSYTEKYYLILNNILVYRTNATNDVIESKATI